MNQWGMFWDYLPFVDGETEAQSGEGTNKVTQPVNDGAKIQIGQRDGSQPGAICLSSQPPPNSLKLKGNIYINAQCVQCISSYNGSYNHL